MFSAKPHSFAGRRCALTPHAIMRSYVGAQGSHKPAISIVRSAFAGKISVKRVTAKHAMRAGYAPARSSARGGAGRSAERELAKTCGLKRSGRASPI
jgi:hypothetical protein